MPRLFSIGPGLIKPIQLSVDASQDIKFILCRKELVLLEPGEFADELMGNALLLNSPTEFKLVDKFDRITVSNFQTVYLVSTNPDCYVINDELCNDNQRERLLYMRTIVRLP